MLLSVRKNVYWVIALLSFGSALLESVCLAGIGGISLETLTAIPGNFMPVTGTGIGHILFLERSNQIETVMSLSLDGTMHEERCLSGKVITLAAASPSGMELAIVRDFMSIEQQQMISSVTKPLTGAKMDIIRAITYTPNGLILLAGGGKMSRERTVAWDVVTGEIKARFRGHEYPVYCIAVSTDSKILASGDGLGIIRFWDINSGNELAVHKPANLKADERVSSLAFSARENSLATGRFNGRVDILRIQDNKISDGPSFVMNGREAIVSWSPDGKLLCVGDWKGEVTIWRLTPTNSVESVCGKSVGGRVKAISFAYETNRIVVNTDRAVTIFRIVDEKTSPLK